MTLATLLYPVYSKILLLGRDASRVVDGGKTYLCGIASEIGFKMLASTCRTMTKRLKSDLMCVINKGTLKDVPHDAWAVDVLLILALYLVACHRIIVMGVSGPACQ